MQQMTPTSLGIWGWGCGQYSFTPEIGINNFLLLIWQWVCIFVWLVFSIGNGNAGINFDIDRSCMHV